MSHGASVRVPHQVCLRLAKKGRRFTLSDPAHPLNRNF